MSEKGIHPFWGGPLSQWAKCDITVDDTLYNCAEQYMMAAKARLFRDAAIYDQIMARKDPRDQKKLGRKVKGFNKEMWNEVAKDVVLRGNIAKFTQNPEMAEYLVKTEDDIIVEASPYDRVWGVGIGPEDERIWIPDEWEGANWLGKVLMEVRTILVLGSNVEQWGMT